MGTRQYIELGSAPHEERCAQVGEANYSANSRRECEAFKAQILRSYPIAPGVNAGVTIQVMPHDFGSYREVALAYDCEGGFEWASRVERDEEGKLVNWDEQAREALGLAMAT